jgi:O-antigen ligase
MAYLACLLYIAVTYIRPGEIIPGWIGFPFLQFAGGFALFASAVSLAFKPRNFVALPSDWCFLGYCVAIILSRPANGWFGGGYLALLDILPLLMFYLLIRLGIQTEGQLRGLMAALVLLTLFQAGNGILQYHTGMGLGGSTAYVRVQVDPAAEDGAEAMTRIRGTGIFGDPNDLAMSLVLALPFLFSWLLSPASWLMTRLISVGGIAVILYALALTQSRGGFLAFAALCAVYAYRRFGRVTAVVVAVMVIAVLVAAGPSRLQGIDSSEASAQGRIQSWAAGLQMLKSQPILGVGYGNFGDFNALTAHNSFVHAFAETGLVGGLLFVGLWYWFYVMTSAYRNVAGAATSRLALDLLACGVGVMVCAVFLSRQYSPVLYIPLALGAARVAAARPQPHAASFYRQFDWIRIGLFSIGVVIGTYVVVIVLARWSGA